MVKLNILHRTAYRYRRAVNFGAHRLMLRPRESRDLRVISAEIATTPPATVTWAQDVFGNAVAIAEFQAMGDALVVESEVDLELSAMALPIFNIAASAISYPFQSVDAEWTDLGALTRPQFPDQAQRLSGWARGFLMGDRTDTLSLLKDLSAGVSDQIRYQSREVEGVQSPTETLDRGWGSCRDFAVLFIEAVRCLGFGARIASGYLHNPGDKLRGSTATGATHAWAEVYVPGAGWTTFDPTNRSLGGANLIPVAVARDIRQTMPVTGSFIGAGDAFDSISVQVQVTARSG